MELFSAEELLGQQFGVEVVELPGTDKAVKVRALTRAEALSVRGQEMEVDELERKLLAMAMVEPKLTEAQIRQWQEVAPAGQLVPVVNTVERLSGMTRAAQRSAYDDFRGEPGS